MPAHRPAHKGQNQLCNHPLQDALRLESAVLPPLHPSRRISENPIQRASQSERSANRQVTPPYVMIRMGKAPVSARRSLSILKSSNSRRFAQRVCIAHRKSPSSARHSLTIPQTAAVTPIHAARSPRTSTARAGTHAAAPRNPAVRTRQTYAFVRPRQRG